MKLIEFGDCPPPFGGVTVHFRRLLERLDRDEFEITHVGRRSAPPDPRHSFTKWPTFPGYLNHLEFVRGMASPFGHGILHIHDNPVFFAPLVALHVLRGGKALITVHDQMLSKRLSRALPHERVAFRWATKSPSVRWVAVSRNVQRILQQYGVTGDHVSVVPAYLSPSEGNARGSLPDAVKVFVRGHDPSLVVYGYSRQMLEGRDLYGFDFSLRVLCDVVKAAPNAGLVVLCPGASYHSDVWKPLREEVQFLGLNEHVLFLFEPLQEPLALWQRCSVMLRPTLTDGDSVAVREMLTLGRPVVASDVAPRPNGTKVLSLGSPAEWAQAVLDCISTSALDREPSPPVGDGYAEIRRALSALTHTT